MKLVASSRPGLVERAHAIQLLVAWDVLVRSVCRELADRPGPRTAGERANAALELLYDWKMTKGFLNARPTITFPDDCDRLYAQVLAGEEVCCAFALLASADTESDVWNDFLRIESALSRYWEQYPSPIFPPELEPN